MVEEFVSPFCLENGDIKSLKNMDACMPNYMASHTQKAQYL